MAKKHRRPPEKPLWYKDAVIYEVHVKTFADSNRDGIGDFRGLIEKLDYLADLGVTAIWLLPFYPSPLRDDGYDIADYYSVHPDYGTLSDFKLLLREAHARNLRVITELVVNHTSDQHPWFKRAREAKPGSKWRDFYVWSDTDRKYQDARIIFKDFEPSNWSWDPVAGAYYWHRFYSHQPDLNYESAHMRKAIFRVMDFWFDMGVDGLRLDAVPYLYEKEGTNCENLPETYEFLETLRAHVDEKYKDRMLLAEANQWPEDAARYFGKDGRGCHMCFHFPLMPRMFMAIEMEDRFPMVDILEQTPPISETSQWAMFLRNHDELTLEMVTDEERDYMYRVYARDPRARLNLGIRRRLAPLINNNRAKMELMNVMLFTMPGTPILYYGDEIGMGDNYYLGDRNGVRTPMQWSSDRNAGFSKTNPQRLYLPVIIDPEYNYETVNVETQQGNTESLLWWMKRMITIRKRHQAFGHGEIEFLLPDNPKVMAYIRRGTEECILVIVNLSRQAQAAELDLHEYAGRQLEDLFSRNDFPEIPEDGYPVTLAPYGYYLFKIKPEEEPAAQEPKVREMRITGHWRKVFEGRQKERIERDVLQNYIAERRWFRSKSRKITRVTISDNIYIADADCVFLIIDVNYTEGSPEKYVLPAAFAYLPTTPEDTRDEGGGGGAQSAGGQGAGSGGGAGTAEASLAEPTLPLLEDAPQAAIHRIKVDGLPGILYDATYNEGFRNSLFSLMHRKKKLRGAMGGELHAYSGRRFRALLNGNKPPLPSQVHRAEQTNTSITYSDLFFFKIFRQLEAGLNPDPEIVRFLTDKTRFEQIAPFGGAIEYRQKGGGEPAVLGMLQGLVPNEGDAWVHTIDEVEHCFERILSRRPDPSEISIPSSIFDIEFSQLPELLQELVGGIYAERAWLLGKRTAEMHTALASVLTEPDFAPEQFSMLWQRSAFQSMRSQSRRVFSSLRKTIKKLPETVQADSEALLKSQDDIVNRFKEILTKKFPAQKTRIHGDYHLGQVLHTGKDFVIIDFEGEPARALSERRLKRSPLVDVAGMIRSFHYAAFYSLFKRAERRPEEAEELAPWVLHWYLAVSGTFLSSYLETVGEDAAFLPPERADRETLLNAFLLDKAVYEVGYELNNRPDWLVIPLRGIEHLLGLSK